MPSLSDARRCSYFELGRPVTAQFTELDHVCYVPAVHDQRMLCCYEIFVTIRQFAQFIAFLVLGFCLQIMKKHAFL